MKKLLFLTILFLSSFFLTKNVFAATEFISVIDPGNGSGTDYTSLSAWEAANQVDLTAATTLVIAGSLTRGTIADGTPITQTTSGATAICVHHSATQMLISTLSGTPDATSTWFPTVDGSDATNAWTPTDAGDSAIAIAKCRSTAGTADTTAVTVDGWTTSATNYIKIWTDPSENYRHNGVWDEGKYRLEITGNSSAINAISGNVWVDGLQIKRITSSSYGSIYGITNSGVFKASNNIINVIDNYTNTTRAIFNNASNLNTYYWNNIIYGTNLDYGYYQSSSYGFVYNNSVIGAVNGYYSSFSLVMTVKNNIAQGSTDGFFASSDLFASGSDYNISDLASDAPSPSYRSNLATEVIFADEANQDFHLDSADTGARNRGAILYDSGDDANLNFTTDIDNNARLDSAGTWDIGADEAITKVYRSVGPSATTAIATGATYGNVEIKPAYVSGSTTNIADYVATFWSDLPTNVGVGDALQYDDDDDGDIDASDSIVFITKRIDATHYSVRTASGTAPASTLAPDSDWSIFRSYTSLFNAEAGDENDSIDDDLEAFESWSGGKNLQTGQEQWNIAAYANGTTADTVATTIDGWTTTADSYIKVYTPTRSDEVGVSQRHSGIWDTTKYRLEITDNSVINAYENYIHIDGLQIASIQPTGNERYGFYSRWTTSDDNDVRISNSIIKGHGNDSYYQMGIRMDSPSIGSIWNNIIYDIANDGDTNNISVSAYTGNVYNNTIVDSYFGFRSTSGSLLLKNNTCQNSGACYSGTFDASSDYNVSNISQADADNANVSFNGYKTVSFVDSTNNDFHLAPGDTGARNFGADLSNDPYIPFNTDIDSACLRKDNQSRVSNGGDDSCYTRPRGTSWDIGADELITKIFRSVAPDADGTLEALTTGATNAMTIASSTATFATALADNIGVGDAIQYDADGDSDIDASDSIVFISGRTDSTHFTVKTASGTIPTAVSADTDWSLFRAYTSVSNARRGDENLAIDVDLRNFDTWQGYWPYDHNIASSSEQWNIACYANGTTADTTRLDLGNWTTSASNYLRLYTPYLPTEVGISQRHNGKWDDNKFRMEYDAVASNESILRIFSSYVRIEGLQLSIANNDYSAVRAISAADASSGDAYISFNLMRGEYSTSGTDNMLAVYTGGASSKFIYNNITYGFQQGAWGSGAFFGNGAGAIYFYNNTIIGGQYGYYAVGGNTLAKNNIFQGNGVGVDGYYGAGFNASSDYNISDVNATDAPNATFANDYVNVGFADETNDDFHLSPSDTAARNSGVDLSQDYYLPITNDIDGHARPASARGYGVATDIGADESATPIFRSIAPGMATYLDRGVDESGTDLTISGTTLTLENAAPDNVGVGDAIQYDSDGNSSIDAIAFISSRSSSTSFTVQARDGANPVAVTNDQDWQIFRAYTTLDNAEGGAENTANIDDDVDDFDISVSRNDGKDIYTSNEQWNIAAYANGTTADTNAVTINDWTTGAQNYIKIYTPVSVSEVGVSQRHSGKWDDGKYKLQANGAHALRLYDEYVRVDGLQIFENDLVSTRYGIFTDGLGRSEFFISNNIVYSMSGNGGYAIWSHDNDTEDVFIWNNLIYGGWDNGITSTGNYGYSYIYNNTIIGCENIGISGDGIGSGPPTDTIVYARNNIVVDTVSGNDWFLVDGSPYSTNNISNGETPSGDNAILGRPVFVDEANFDFHLSSSDTSARDAGVNLWSDANIAIKSDIDGDPRSESVENWDIGADEAITYQSNVSGMGTATMQMSLTDKMTDGLVGMWSFDGPDIDWTTNTAYDRSPAGGNNGTITGATPAIGKRGQALNFNGTTDFVDVGNINLSGEFSIAYWFWSQDNSLTGIIIGEDSGSGGATPKIGQSGGNFLLRIISDSSNLISLPTQGEWNFVVVTRDSSDKIDLYINDGSASRLFSDVAQSGIYTVDKLGTNGGDLSQKFYGKIDEVRIYNRVLSSSEILRLYNLGNVEYVR